MKTAVWEDLLLALSTLEGAGKSTTIQHEHSAFWVHDSLKADLACYEKLGYTVLKTTDEIAWIQRDNSRIELIPRNTQEHEAWATSTATGFGNLYAHLTEDLSEDCSAFEQVTELKDTRDLKHCMFRHRATGQVVQIIWRLFPIYKFVFN
ncbi:MAG: hypothetical protein V4467_04010 [Patescibacteria group bacterium]